MSVTPGHGVADPNVIPDVEGLSILTVFWTDDDDVFVIMHEVFELEQPVYWRPDPQLMFSPAVAPPIGRLIVTVEFAGM